MRSASACQPSTPTVSARPVSIEAQLPGIEEQVARGLLDAAHQACPYSRATRGNVVQDVRLVTDED